MAIGKNKIMRCAMTGMFALLLGLPAAAARASAHGTEPGTAAEAQALAQHYQARAEHARALGSVGYKTEEIQRAEAQQAKYSAMQENLSAQPVWTTPPSPLAERYNEIAEHYRAIAGGPAYKWGRVDWAEAQARHYEALEAPPAPQAQMLEILPEPAPEPSDRPACETVSKPVVRPLMCAR
jgi:hypothetical protein